MRAGVTQPGRSPTDDAARIRVFAGIRRGSSPRAQRRHQLDKLGVTPCTEIIACCTAVSHERDRERDEPANPLCTTSSGGLKTEGRRFEPRRPCHRRRGGDRAATGCPARARLSTRTGLPLRAARRRRGARGTVAGARTAPARHDRSCLTSGRFPQAPLQPLEPLQLPALLRIFKTGRAAAGGDARSVRASAAADLPAPVVDEERMPVSSG